MKRRIALVPVLIAAMAGTPATGTSGETFASLARDPARADRLARQLVVQASDPSPTAVLRAMLRSQGLDVAPATGVVPPARFDAPPGVAGPLARLAGALDEAESLRAAALAALTEQELALAGTGLLGVRPGPRMAAVRGRIAEPSAAGWERDPRAEAIAARVDEAALRRAAVTVLAALEESAPQLRLVPAVPLDAPSTCGVVGDVIYETSDCSVIVGGSSTNEYGPGVDPRLLIDLGGDDVYANGAARGEGNVRALLDLGGADTYTEAASATQPGGVFAVTGQGGGFAGIGVLVDLGGADTYTASATATAPEPGEVARAAQAFAQGVGILGAGVLVDVGGPNSFTLTASSAGGSAASEGQGQGLIGLGALLSLATVAADATDTYEATATSTLHLVEKTTGFERFRVGAVQVDAQGASALAGAGIAVDAGGDDTYVAEARGGIAQVYAQGAAQAGAGVLVDTQGSDAMRASSLGDTSLSLVTTDPSVCWSVEVIVAVGDTNAIAQGGTLAGVGALVDGTGNDTRRVEALSRAAATANATSDLDCTSLGGNRAIATATSGDGDAQSQGSAEAGVAALVDLEGADASTLEAHSEAVAHAIATSPGSDTETPTATEGNGRTLGQGHATIGVGVIADLLGLDRYASTATSYVETLTSTIGAAMLRPGVQQIHGWGAFGPGWLLDLDGNDEYSSNPEPASAARNNACWSNSPEGRGRDLQLGALIPPGCP